MYIMSPLAGLGGGILWRPPAYSLLFLRFPSTSSLRYANAWSVNVTFGACLRDLALGVNTVFRLSPSTNRKRMRRWPSVSVSVCLPVSKRANSKMCIDSLRRNDVGGLAIGTEKPQPTLKPAHSNTIAGEHEYILTAAHHSSLSQMYRLTYFV